MIFQWNDDLVTGVADIDSQHKELFARINLLLQECENSNDKNAIVKYLDFLREYVALHFQAEEREMTIHNYPGVGEHRAEHELFQQKINQLMKSYTMQGVNIQVVAMTIRASGDWLLNHIYKTDKALAAFLKRQAD